MIQKEDIYNFVTNPSKIDEATCEDLYKLLGQFPYCEKLYWIYLRKLYIEENIIFEDELLKYGMYISNRKLFYNFMTYSNEYTISEEGIPTEQLISAAPDYFSIVENSNHQETLQELASKLKKARLERAKNIETPKEEKVKIGEEKRRDIEITSNESPLKILTSINNTNRDNKTSDNKTNETPAIIKTEKTTKKVEYNEQTVQKLIKEKKYLAAHEILSAINLNNPKKSVYFALQLKYLETIINNNNKIS